MWFASVLLRNLICVSLCALSAEVSSQVLTPDGKVTAAPTATSAYVRKSSFEVPFSEIPGTAVLFAAWETRVSDFEAFVRESGYSWNYKPHFPQTGSHPVVNVTLRDAIAFCNWLTKRERDSGAITKLQSYRLPTGHEWDAAVGLLGGRRSDLTTAERERDKQSFVWGLEWPPPKLGGNLNSLEISGTDDGYAFTSPTGFFTPTAEGLFDLAGNVWEWTWDQEARSDALGALRGGSWMYFRKECLLSSYEYVVPADLRAASVGFRCVFEDKQRSAAFLASSQEKSMQRDKERREQLIAGGPAVTADEVNKMRKQLEDKPENRPSAPKLPDIKTLAPARTGQVFTNSLGMTLRPLGDAARLLMGEHEVRIQDYEASMAAQGKSWERKPTFAYTETHPVVNITWQEADDFCKWLTERDRSTKLIGVGDGYRLPSDLEWSKAVGLEQENGGTPEARHLANKTDFPWGKEQTPPVASANLDTARISGYQDLFSNTAPVGSFSPNSLHLHDLAGNVAEWCSDVWPAAAGEHVIRGSSWLSSSKDSLLSSARQHMSATSYRPDLGFRIVLEIAQP